MSDTMKNCEFDSSCRSFSCCAELKYFLKKETYLTSVDYNPCTGMLTLAVDAWTKQINLIHPSSGMY